MRGRLPRTADFLLLAENNREYEGTIPVIELGRLHDTIDSTDGDVAVSLKFGWKYGIRCLEGSVSAQLGLICQRCLEPMPADVEGRFCFALITDENELDNLPDEMEPYIIEGDKQLLDDVVVDELLISIPLVAKHTEMCVEFQSDEDVVVADDTYKPFASIKDLLN